MLPLVDYHDSRVNHASENDLAILESAYLMIRTNVDDLAEEYVAESVLAHYEPGITLARLTLEASDGKCTCWEVLRGARLELNQTVDQWARNLGLKPEEVKAMEGNPWPRGDAPNPEIVSTIREYLRGDLSLRF